MWLSTAFFLTDYLPSHLFFMCISEAAQLNSEGNIWGWVRVRVRCGRSNGERTNWSQRCNETAQVAAVDEAGRDAIPSLERWKWGIMVVGLHFCKPGNVLISVIWLLHAEKVQFLALIILECLFHLTLHLIFLIRDDEQTRTSALLEW